MIINFDFDIQYVEMTLLNFKSSFKIHMIENDRLRDERTQSCSIRSADWTGGCRTSSLLAPTIVHSRRLALNARNEKCSFSFLFCPFRYR